MVESAYRVRGKSVAAVRSNYDFGQIHKTKGIPLFKLHGCISQDAVDGHRGRMILTERDYEEFSDYRQVLFRRLAADLASKDVLFIGYSLCDPHVKRDVHEAAKLQEQQGAPGRIFLLMFEPDEYRAQLFTQRGIQVSFGSLDDFIHAVSSRPEAATPVLPQLPGDDFLSTRQRVATLDVPHASGLQADAEALFHGRAPTYADIAAELVVAREGEEGLIGQLEQEGWRFLHITGVAGVGKTSLARRIVHSLSGRGFHAWEHKPEFPFRSAEWLEVDKKLDAVHQRGVVLVDDCLDALTQVNALARGLVKHGHDGLRVILTANHAQWVPRIKAPELFAAGTSYHLSQLTPADIERLVNLLDRKREIARLVDAAFGRLSRADRIQHLRRRCRADMFVCLKSLFSFESLDTILLREFSGLDSPLQEIYRHVAVLEAAGATVHRQLVLRLMSIDFGMLTSHLHRLEGLIDEVEINSAQGLYEWRTRHEVIAQTIARYKFSEDTELQDLLSRVIDNLNPTVWVELRAISRICGREFGIGQIADPQVQCDLYRKLIRLAPGERVPRHRLISTLLHMGEVDSAEDEIRDASRAVRLDPPLHRYLVKVKIRRSRDTEGIAESDRLAMLRDAERSACEGIERFRTDKLAYQVYAQVGEAIADLTGDCSTLDAAIHSMRFVADEILDPHFDAIIREAERTRESATFARR